MFLAELNDVDMTMQELDTLDETELFLRAFLIVGRQRRCCFPAFTRRRSRKRKISRGGAGRYGADCRPDRARRADA
ncbi:MAG: hypothetical protein R2912_10615 [Eubacteriales bacterium]